MNTQHHTSTARCRWSVYFLSSSLAQCNIYLSCFILKVKYVSRHVTSCPCVFLPPSLSTPDPNYSPDFPLLSLLILVSSLLFRIPVFPVFFLVFFYVCFTLIGFLAFGLTCVWSSVRLCLFELASHVYFYTWVCFAHKQQKSWTLLHHIFVL